MGILDTLKKNSTIKETDILSDSTLFNEKDMITTEVPMVNVALSGSLEGGLAPGITTIAGPSRYFKSNFALLLAKSYLDKYPKDGAILLYDTEFGTPKSYFEAFNIDMEKVIHTPVTDVEVLGRGGGGHAHQPRAGLSAGIGLREVHGRRPGGGRVRARLGGAEPVPPPAG